MADLDLVRGALTTRLADVEGLDRVFGLLADTIKPPCAYLVEDDPFIDYDMVLQRGADVFNFKVVIYAARGPLRTSQQLLDGFRAGDGPTSVKAALESSWPDADAGVHYADVKTVSHVSGYTIASVEYLGIVFTVEVVA